MLPLTLTEYFSPGPKPENQARADHGYAKRRAVQDQAGKVLGGHAALPNASGNQSANWTLFCV